MRQRTPPEQWRIHVRRNQPRSPAFRWCCGNDSCAHNWRDRAAVANARASKKVARDVNGRSEAAGTDATVVLVHGAWADGSSWAHVITLLQSEGLKTMAVPIPLTSLSDDVAALERALERTDGPVVLVAHAYAGAVIGAVTQDRVAREMRSSFRLSLPTKAKQSRKCSIATSRRRRRRNSPPTVMVSSGCRTTGLAQLGASMPT